MYSLRCPRELGFLPSSKSSKFYHRAPIHQLQSGLEKLTSVSSHSWLLSQASWILKVFPANYLHPLLSDFLEKIHTNILISGYLPGTFSFMKCHHIHQSQCYLGTSNHPNSRALYSKVKYNNSFDCLTQVEKCPCPTAGGGFTFEAHTAMQHCMLQKTKYHLVHKFIWRKGEKKKETTSINMTQH